MEVAHHLLRPTVIVTQIHINAKTVLPHVMDVIIIRIAWPVKSLITIYIKVAANL